MLIEFFSSERQRRTYYYDSDKRYTVISSNNNLAFAKCSYNEDVCYSLNQKGGEDAYLCLKHLKAKNRYMINQEMQIKHYPRKGILNLTKQFYNYSLYFNDAIHLTGYKNAEIYSYIPFINKYFNRYKLLSFKFPLPIMLILTQFHLLVLSIPVLYFLGEYLIAQLIGLVLIYSYFKEDLRGIFWGGRKIITLSLTRLIVNISILFGALHRSIKNKNFILMPNILEYPHRSSRIVSKLSKLENTKNQSIISTLTHSYLCCPEDLKIEWLRFGWGYLEYKGKHILLKNMYFFKVVKILKIVDKKHELVLK